MTKLDYLWPKTDFLYLHKSSWIGTIFRTDVQYLATEKTTTLTLQIIALLISSTSLHGKFLVFPILGTTGGSTIDPVRHRWCFKKKTAAALHTTMWSTCKTMSYWIFTISKKWRLLLTSQPNFLYHLHPRHTVLRRWQYFKKFWIWTATTS